MQYYKFHHDLRFFVRTEYGISVQSAASCLIIGFAIVSTSACNIHKQ